MQNRIKTALLCYTCLISLLAAGNSLAESVLPRGIIALSGQDAPPLILKDLDQTGYDIKQSRGKWVFTHFWASWCGPCRKEMPTIQAIASEFKHSKLDIVLINTAEDEDTVFNFLGIVAPDLNTLMDTDGLVTERWQPRGLPATYLVNPEGKIKYIALGGRPWDKLEYLNFLRQLIKQ